MNRRLAEDQNAFQASLTRYVNGSFASRTSLLVSLLSGRRAHAREASAVIAAWHATAAAGIPQPGIATVTVDIPLYAGGNVQANRLMRELAALEPLLAGAYVHGSVGSHEEIPYSDFDALVILRDAAFASSAVLAGLATRLSALRRLMFEYDPLQHHGWFVLAERDLQNYCQAWFPVVLFAHARSLLPRSGTRLSIRPRDSTTEYRAAFSGLAAATLRRLETGPPPTGAYALKGLLSQFMLLPTLYLQARDGTAVFKRESFALAAPDFPPAIWTSMERVSALRLAWHYELSGLQRLALTRTLPARPLATRWLAPSADVAVRERLTPGLWRDMAALVRAMQAGIAAVDPTIAAQQS